MKNNLLLIAFLFTGFLMQAQDVTSGVRVAVNISNLDFEPDATFGNTHRNGRRRSGVGWARPHNNAWQCAVAAGIGSDIW